MVIQKGALVPATYVVELGLYSVVLKNTHFPKWAFALHLRLICVVEYITADVMFFSYGHLVLVGNVLKHRCSAISSLMVKVASANWWLCKQIRGRPGKGPRVLLFIRETGVKLWKQRRSQLHITTALRPTFMADKWPSVVPPCAFWNVVVQHPTLVQRHMLCSCTSQL